MLNLKCHHVVKYLKNSMFLLAMFLMNFRCNTKNTDKASSSTNNTIQKSSIDLQKLKIPNIVKIDVFCWCFNIPDTIHPQQTIRICNTSINLDSKDIAIIENLKYTNTNIDSCKQFLDQLYLDKQSVVEHSNITSFPARFVCLLHYKDLPNDTISFGTIEAYIINRKAFVKANNSTFKFKLIHKNIIDMCN